eukprot:115725-Lingulodinium_polyedra.AAC.1
MGRQRSRRVRRCAVPCAPPARSRRTWVAALRFPPAATSRHSSPWYRSHRRRCDTRRSQV